ncbi:UPF0175 family protein [Anaerolineales bacterium HSG6]|nr:UPF0175 family protein [Anaerolineales bacterium HSG6]
MNGEWTKKESIPEQFNNAEEAGEFWDTHSAADYWDEMDEIEVTFDIQKRIFLIPSLRWSIVVGAYQDEQINLGKAAELLELHELELRDRFIELGIPLRLGPATLAEAKAEVRAMQSWFDTKTVIR